MGLSTGEHGREGLMTASPRHGKGLSAVNRAIPGAMARQVAGADMRRGTTGVRLEISDPPDGDSSAGGRHEGACRTMVGEEATGEPPRLVLVVGVAGSGKSTVGCLLAERLGWAYRDGDAFHSEANRAKMAAGHALTDSDRQPWLDAIGEWMDRATAAGQRAVVTCSAHAVCLGADFLGHGKLR